MHPPSTPDERSMYFSYVNPRSPGNAGTPRTGPAGILAHGDGHQRQAARVPADLNVATEDLSRSTGRP